MRITWRGLELPTRVERDSKMASDRYGIFLVEPFERGLGTTIGNSLRRVLLSSLEGSAVTSIKIAGVNHEFTSIKGVMEDVTDIVAKIFVFMAIPAAVFVIAIALWTVFLTS